MRALLSLAALLLTACADGPAPEPAEGIEGRVCPVDPATCFETEVTEDVDLDGVIDSRTVIDRDANGTWRSELRDIDGDGMWDVARQQTLDDAGRIVESLEDWDGDGTFEDVTLVTWVSVGQDVFATWDIGGDGIADRIVSLRYDDRGRQVQATTDDGADGVIDERIVTAYDDAARSTLMLVDAGDDGVIDIEWSEVRDEAGRLIELSYTVGGVLMAWVNTTYDDCGRATRSEVVEGGMGYIAETTYDDGGRVTGMGIDDGADGTVDRHVTVTWTGNDGVETTLDADKQVIRRRFLTSDDRGLVVEERTDLDLDGSPDDARYRSWMCIGE